MSFDDHANFSYSTISVAPSPATSGTSLAVVAGDGARFPTAPFNAVVWPSGSNPLHATAEVIRVTGKSTDTLTITRAQESSSARSIVVGDQIMAAVTAKTLTDIENTAVQSGTSFPVSPASGDWFYRTDRNVLYFYNWAISRWLSVDLKHVTFAQPAQFIGSTTVGSGLGQIPIFDDIYVENWVTVTDVLTTSNVSNFYTCQLFGNLTVISSFDTSGDTAGTRTSHTITLNTLYQPATYQWLEYVVSTRTGSPGAIYSTSMLTYRAAG